MAPLITDPPLTNLTNKKIKIEEEKEEKKLYMWHVTWDTWHVTRDMWHMTNDSWGEGTFSQNFSSLALPVWEWTCYDDIFTKADSVNQSINEWWRYLKNSPAAPGLLINLKIAWKYMLKLFYCLVKKKSRIRETKNLSTNADSSTNTF